MIHRRTHPNLDVEGCFSCRVSHVTFGAECMPTRKPTEIGYINKERQWDSDMDAYKRLKNDGVQPERIDGCAKIEARAEEKYQVEMGLV
jgi:hypothetical protein